MDNKIIRDLFLGFIKIHILYHAKKDKIYGKEFVEELQRHGYNISYGTLYPIFHRMEKDNLLICENINVSGKIRKYYTITPDGESVLKEAKEKVKELVDEVVK